MKFFEGDIQNAISNRKIFSSAFIVFVENKEPESLRFHQLLEEENQIPAKEYVAFRISPSSESYRHFLEVYREVPVPSVFVIGADGIPIKILSDCEPKEDFYAEIKEAVEAHKTARKAGRLQNEALVQILLKLPKGETVVVEFPETSLLNEVRAFVKESLQVKGAFSLVAPFPKKTFSKTEETQSLVELELSPTSTLFVVPANHLKLWTMKSVSDFLVGWINRFGRTFRALRDWFFGVLPRRS